MCDQDLADGINACMNKAGQNAATAILGGFRLTNMAVGTDGAHAATVSQLRHYIEIVVGDETTAITAGTQKATFRLPYAMSIASVKASLTTAQTSGSIFTVDVKWPNGPRRDSIFSTNLTIDNTERTSTTAATPATLITTNFLADTEMTIDIDQVGDGTAKGLKVYLLGTFSS